METSDRKDYGFVNVPLKLPVEAVEILINVAEKSGLAAAYQQKPPDITDDQHRNCLAGRTLAILMCGVMPIAEALELLAVDLAKQYVAWAVARAKAEKEGGPDGPK